MSDDDYRSGFEGEAEATPAEEPVAEASKEEPAEKPLTPEQIIGESESESIAVEVKTVDDDVVDGDSLEEENAAEAEPEEPVDDEAVDRLAGAIGDGDIETDYPEVQEPSVDPEEPEQAEEEPVAESEVKAEEANKNDEPEAVAAPVAQEENVMPERTKIETNEAAAPVTEVAPKKKSKKGLVITLIIIFLLLIGGGVAFLIWMLNHESPQVSVNDAIASAWKADNIQFTGGYSVKSDDSSDQVTTVSLNGSKNGSNIYSKGSFKIDSNADGVEEELNYEVIYVYDKQAVYLKVEDISDILTSIIDTSNNAQAQSGNDYFAQYGKMMKAYVPELAEAISGSWIRFKADDVRKNNSSLSNVIDALDAFIATSSDGSYAASYQDHPFFKVESNSSVEEKNGVKYYSLNTDESARKEFSTEIKDKNSKAKDVADKMAGTANKDSETKYKIGVKSWSHELSHIDATNDSNDMNLSLDLSYGGGDEIAEPSSYKTSEEVGKDIMSVIKKMLTGIATAAADDYCKQSGFTGAQLDACKLEAKTALDQLFASFSLESFLGGNEA